MRRTLYLADEPWELAKAMAGDDGRRESGAPLSVSAFIGRLILAEKRSRSRISGSVGVETGGLSARERLTAPRAGGSQPAASTSPRQPRVQGPITKADTTRRKGK